MQTGTIAVIGANGATGKLVVEQLLNAGHTVKAIVRPTSIFPESWSNSEKLILLKKDITGMSVDELSGYLTGCKALVCCMGHNTTLKGIFGKPQKLVSIAVSLACEAILKTTPPQPFRFVLMNTAGNSNRAINEPVSFGQRTVVALLRTLLPPQADNEKAADYLVLSIGQQHPAIEWVVVRPDTLITSQTVTPYTVHTSPVRSAIFQPGKTSRINVAHFMIHLLTDDEVWEKWKGQMPVIYNAIDA